MRKLKRSECAVLPLVLKGKWFDMIERGEKREEYRTAKPYWNVRVANWSERYTKGRMAGTIARGRIVEFRRGHSRGARRMAFLVQEVVRADLMASPRTLRAEWGEPETPHWVFRLGGRVVLEE